MAKIAILIEDQYEDIELWYPYYRLREEGMETVLVGTGKDEYKSKHGYPGKPVLSIKNAKVDDFDGVVIPGGYAPDLLRRHKEVIDFVRNMYNEEKLVAAICHAGWVLASAGILRGKNATGFFSIKDDMVNAGAKYLDKEVVVDGNIITSRKPDDMPFFCKEIINFLKGSAVRVPEAVGAMSR